MALLFSGTCPASTYYVSLGGKDTNSCATATTQIIADNKRTVAAGVACAVAGDTVYIRGGLHTGPDATIDSQQHTVNSGTSFSNAVTISGFPGETAILQPPDHVSAVRLTNGAPHYVIIQDLVVDMVHEIHSGSQGGADAVYLSSGAHHNRFLRLEVKNNFASAFQFSDTNGNSPFNEVLECDVHHNGQAPGEHNGYGFYIGTSDNLFEGNHVHDNASYGFHIYDNAGTLNVDRNIVRKNRVHGNGTHGGDSAGIMISTGTGNTVVDNVVSWNVVGIRVYTNATESLVSRNLVYGNSEDGIALQYYGSGILVRDNVLYENGQAIVDYGGLATPTIERNRLTKPQPSAPVKLRVI